MPRCKTWLSEINEGKETRASSLPSSRRWIAQMERGGKVEMSTDGLVLDGGMESNVRMADEMEVRQVILIFTLRDF